MNQLNLFPPKTYVLYFRVSTKRQGDSGLGLQAQRTYINHFYHDKTVIAEFTDVQSGKDVFNRPQLRMALDLCHQRQAILVVAKIDRLSRNTEQALTIYRELSGRVESCDIPNLDKFTLTLFMAIADRERELIGLRTKEALAEKVKRSGQWRIGSQAFIRGDVARLGHIAVKAKAAANLNSRRATALIEKLVGEGMNWADIARKLNADGFRTPRNALFQSVQVQRLHKRLTGQSHPKRVYAQKPPTKS